MIKLSLNSPDIPKQQVLAPFASTLAAAVEAAGAQPLQSSIAQVAVKKQPKQVQAQLPSNGLLTRGVRWMQQKGRSKKRMQMIETVSLGEKRFVALVKVDGREFLLGGAPSSVGMLADLGAHGLGDLLSLPTAATETNVPETVTVPVTTELPKSIASAPFVLSEPLQLPEASIVDPMILPLPVSTVKAVAEAAPVESARVNITVEADEDESDWLLQDDLDTVFKSVSAVEPATTHKEAAKVIEIRPEPVLQKATAVVEQPAPVIVAPKAAAPIVNTVFANANFTFQMWPSASVAATTIAPTLVPPAVSAPKAKTGIDLESCPELLGEPYLLALVQKSRGAAA